MVKGHLSRQAVAAAALQVRETEAARQDLHKAAARIYQNPDIAVDKIERLAREKSPSALRETIKTELGLFGQLKATVDQDLDVRRVAKHASEIAATVSHRIRREIEQAQMNQVSETRLMQKVQEVGKERKTPTLGL